MAVGLRKRETVYSDFDWAFTAHPKTGDITVIRNGDSIKRSVKNHILTKYNDRLFYSKKGSNIYGRLFEQFDKITATLLERDIIETLNNFEPRVSIEKIEVIPDYENEGYDINLYCRIINIKKIEEINIFLERIK